MTELLGNSAAAEPFLRKSGRAQHLCEQGTPACSLEPVLCHGLILAGCSVAVLRLAPQDTLLLYLLHS